MKCQDLHRKRVFIDQSDDDFVEQRRKRFQATHFQTTSQVPSTLMFDCNHHYPGTHKDMTKDVEERNYSNQATLLAPGRSCWSTLSPALRYTTWELHETYKPEPLARDESPLHNQGVVQASHQGYHDPTWYRVNNADDVLIEGSTSMESMESVWECAVFNPIDQDQGPEKPQASWATTPVRDFDDDDDSLTPLDLDLAPVSNERTGNVYSYDGTDYFLDTSCNLGQLVDSSRNKRNSTSIACNLVQELSSRTSPVMDGLSNYNAFALDSAALPVIQKSCPSNFVVTMSLPSDRKQLSDYQTLLRQSLEFYAATKDDVETRIRGRKQTIRLNQIGVRCRFCAHLHVRERGNGAVYFPRSMATVYQAAQNIAGAHFNGDKYMCPFVPIALTEELDIQTPKRKMSKSGRGYWIEACRSLGIYEQNRGLWYQAPKEQK